MARQRRYPNIPAYYDFFNVTLKALVELGGSGTNAEINQKVYELAGLSEDFLSVSHTEGEGGASEVDYRLGWTRSYLKYYGLIDNSSRGVWAIKDIAIDPDAYDADEIVAVVRALPNKQNRAKAAKVTELVEPADEASLPDDDVMELEAADGWKAEMLHTLYNLSPDAFERLSQRLLRESGFSSVVVTGKSGDCGIDGKGIVNVNGLLSFPIIFQCKRYRGSVAPRDIRDFRGAMQGRADKGLVITTGTFTRDARKEATRDGVPNIDLIDGDALCEKLKELKLGVSVELVEQVSIDASWFAQFS